MITPLNQTPKMLFSLSLICKLNGIDQISISMFGFFSDKERGEVISVLIVYILNNQIRKSEFQSFTD